MRQLLTVVFVVIFFRCNLFAQDIYYTQFFNSPLTLNPALTGLTRGGYRLGMAYRGQWYGISGRNSKAVPYSVPSLFFDIPVSVNDNDDALGIGGLFLSNVAKDASFLSYTGCVSLSFVKMLGKKNEHQLAAGAQLGYTHKEVSASLSTIEGHLIGHSLIDTATAIKQYGMFNLNAGAVWLGRIDRRLSMYVGASFYSLVSPKTIDTLGNWYIRGNVHVGLDITLGRLVHLLPSVMYLQLQNSNGLVPGITIAYDITPITTVSLGNLTKVVNFTDGSVRADATSIYGAFDYKGLKVGVSYDFAIANKYSPKPGKGAVEVSLIYMGKAQKKNKIIFCPMF